MATKRSGRPASFNREVALRRAVVVFWEQGYDATSLPQLLAGMEVARSSFYAAFGSKHRVMLEALDLYTRELYADMKAAVVGEVKSDVALTALLNVAACSKRPSYGCLFLNTVTELAPRDSEVRLRARRHLGMVDKLFRGLLLKLGHSATTAAAKSAALLALAAGAVALRKAGEPDRRIRRLLAQVAVLAF